MFRAFLKGVTHGRKIPTICVYTGDVKEKPKIGEKLQFEKQNLEKKIQIIPVSKAILYHWHERRREGNRASNLLLSSQGIITDIYPLCNDVLAVNTDAEEYFFLELVPETIEKKQ